MHNFPVETHANIDKGRGRRDSSDNNSSCSGKGKMRKEVKYSFHHNLKMGIL